MFAPVEACSPIAWCIPPASRARSCASGTLPDAARVTLRITHGLVDAEGVEIPSIPVRVRAESHGAHWRLERLPEGLRPRLRPTLCCRLRGAGNDEGLKATEVAADLSVALRSSSSTLGKPETYTGTTSCVFSHRHRPHGRGVILHAQDLVLAAEAMNFSPIGWIMSRRGQRRYGRRRE